MKELVKARPHMCREDREQRSWFPGGGTSPWPRLSDMEERMLAVLAPASLSAHRAPEAHTAMHAEHVSTTCGVRTTAKKELHDEKLMYLGKVLLSSRVAPWAMQL